MEKVHWLGRKRASLKMARSAASAEARLIHYDLAGRYSLRAASADTAAQDLASSLPPSILTPGGPDGSREDSNLAARNGPATNRRANFDDSRGSPKDADDAIDDMIRQNVKLHGA